MVLRITRWQMRGWCGALAVLIASAMPKPSVAQKPADDAALASVFKDWRSRQNLLKSARYVLTGTTEFKDEQLPAGNPIRPRRVTLLLDLTRKRYRMEGSEDVLSHNGSDDPRNWGFRSRMYTSAYGGESLQHYTHRKANGLENDREEDLSIGKGDLGPGAQFGHELSPIFLTHGIVPTVHSMLMVDKWPLAHDPDDFDVAGRQNLRGQNCLLLRTEPSPGMTSISDEFWINLQQQSAIHRLISFSGSNPWIRLDIYWKNTSYGWWVDHWSDTWSPNGRVRRIINFRVESFEPNPLISDSDFKLQAEPGMIVKVSEGPPLGKGLDPFKAASRTYRVLSSGEWEEIAAKGFTTLEGKELPPEWHRRWMAWTIGGCLAIGALLFYVSRRRWKKATL